MTNPPIRSSQYGEPPNDDEVARLVRMAGRPAVPPLDDMTAIKTAGRAEFRRRWVRKREPSRVTISLALAAALGFAALGLILWRSTPDVGPLPAARVASVEVVEGDVTLLRSGGASGTWALEPESVVVAGDRIETALSAGHTALLMGDGVSLRLDGGARVVFVDADTVDLVEGALYVDAAPSAEVASVLRIRTPLGVVQHVGTQFEVRFTEGEEGSLRVRVREGRVLVAREDQTLSLESGEELAVADDGAVVRGEIPTHGAAWDWVLEAAPPFDIEGQSLQVYLDWLARETGWEIVLAEGALDRPADEVMMAGPTLHVRPDETLKIVLPSVDLAHRFVEGRLILEHLTP